LAKQELTKLRETDRLSPDLVFRDPYFLNFLGLADTYSEKDLEIAILREMERFLLELGVGFTFVARQKRIIIDGKDFYIDLLFYHRKLRRLIAIDLKLAAFQAADKGQLELYLRWLEKYEMEPGEETPIGLILCEEKGEEQIELLQLDRSGIRVASYLTDLPPKDVLRKKLKAAADLARRQLTDGRCQQPQPKPRPLCRTPGKSHPSRPNRLKPYDFNGIRGGDLSQPPAPPCNAARLRMRGPRTTSMLCRLTQVGPTPAKLGEAHQGVDRSL